MTKRELKKEFTGVFAKLIRDAQLNLNCVFKHQDYMVNIINNKGDAKISCKNELINTGIDQVTEFQTVLVSSSEMEKEEIDLIAYAQSGQSLQTEIYIDNPKNKHVSIYFNRPIAFMESIIFSFEFIWKSMFPNKEEFYLIHMARPCHQLDFVLKYYKNIADIEFVVFKESRVYGELQKLNLIPEIFQEDFKNNSFKVQLVPDIYFQYKFSWNIK